MLIKIEAIVREEKMEDVKAALNEIQVNGFTVTQIMGCGTQRGYTEYVRGSKIDVFLKPKIKFEIVYHQKTGRLRLLMPFRKQHSPVIRAMVRYSATRSVTLFVSVQVRPDTMRCSRNFCKLFY